MSDNITRELIRTKVEALLVRLGFKPTNIKLMPATMILAQDYDFELEEDCDYKREGYCYKYNELYCGISFTRHPTIHGKVKDWVLIEYASSLYEAENNIFEDGDMIPLDISPEQIIAELEEELVRNINTAL